MINDPEFIGGLTPTKMSLRKRIDNDFTYHKPPPQVVSTFENLRDKAKELAYLFLSVVPEGRELASALTHLETSVFHANAGIARKYPVDSNADQMRLPLATPDDNL